MPVRAPALHSLVHGGDGPSSSSSSSSSSHTRGWPANEWLNGYTESDYILSLGVDDVEQCQAFDRTALPSIPSSFGAIRTLSNAKESEVGKLGGVTTTFTRTILTVPAFQAGEKGGGTSIHTHRHNRQSASSDRPNQADFELTEPPNRFISDVIATMFSIGVPKRQRYGDTPKSLLGRGRNDDDW